MQKVQFVGLLFAAVVAAAATTTVLAASAVTRGEAKVFKTRLGSVVVGTLPKGTPVEVTQCALQRCEVKLPGMEGWVRINRLAPTGGEPLPFAINLGTGPGAGAAAN